MASSDVASVDEWTLGGGGGGGGGGLDLAALRADSAGVLRRPDMSSVRPSLFAHSAPVHSLGTYDGD